MNLIVLTLLITASSFSQGLVIRSGNYTIQPRDNECGVKTVSRIVGGTTASLNEYRWIAALCFSSPCNFASQFCGGSLIEEQYILTAAHCVKGVKAAELFVSLGDYNIASATETKSVEIQAEEIMEHDGYNPNTMRNDIAIIKLKSKVKLSDKIGLICLPPSTPTYAKQTAFVAGWGTTSQNGNSAKVLREVSVPVLTNQVCRERYSVKDISSTMICAGREGKDSCQGDSGGPLMFKSQTGKYQQIGVVSWGVGCGSKEYPGVYTRVNKYLDWIKAHTQSS